MSSSSNKEQRSRSGTYSEVESRILAWKAAKICAILFSAGLAIHGLDLLANEQDFTRWVSENVTILLPDIVYLLDELDSVWITHELVGLGLLGASGVGVVAISAIQDVIKQYQNRLNKY